MKYVEIYGTLVQIEPGTYTVSTTMSSVFQATPLKYVNGVYTIDSKKNGYIFNGLKAGKFITHQDAFPGAQFSPIPPIDQRGWVGWEGWKFEYWLMRI